MTNKVRMLKEAHKAKFRKEQRDPTPDQLEKRRQELMQHRVEKKRSNTNVKGRSVERVHVIQRTQPQSVKDRLKQVVAEQIAKGGRQFHLEQRARSVEFREQNKPPSGVLGSEIPTLREEQRKKQVEMVQKIQEKANNNT